MKRRDLLIWSALVFILSVGLTETFLLFDLNVNWLFVLPFMPLLFNPRKYFVLSIFLIIGVMRSLLGVHTPTVNDIDFYAQNKEVAENVQIEGVICDLPDERLRKTNYVFCVDTLGEKEVQGRILLSVGKFSGFEYGDRLRLWGKLTIPGEAEHFSYRNYLAKDGIYAVALWPKAERISGGHGSFLVAKLFDLRFSFERRLQAVLPEPESSFAAGILLGERGQMLDNITEDFTRAGLLHLLALSGFNITILIVFVFWLLRFAPKNIALMVTFVVIVFFVIMVGATASVVRAAVMGLIGLLALHAGRDTKPLWILTLASALMIFWNPAILLYDVAFQLSVAGVFGITMFVPLLQKLSFFKNLPKTIAFNEAVLATLSAQLVIAPLSAFHFETFSLVAPLANPFLAPLIPPAMALSFVAGIVGYFSIFTGQIIGYFAHLFLKLGLWIAHFFASFPWAQIELQFSTTMLLIWLVIIELVLVLIWRKGVKL